MKELSIGTESAERARIVLTSLLAAIKNELETKKSSEKRARGVAGGAKRGGGERRGGPRSLENRGPSVHMPSPPRTGIQLPFVEAFVQLRFSNDMFSIVCTGYLAWHGVGLNRGAPGEGGSGDHGMGSYHARKSTAARHAG